MNNIISTIRPCLSFPLFASTHVNHNQQQDDEPSEEKGRRVVWVVSSVKQCKESDGDNNNNGMLSRDSWLLKLGGN